MPVSRADWTQQLMTPYLQYQCHLMAVSAEPSEPQSRMVS